jgi:hypothetical protein
MMYGEPRNWKWMIPAALIAPCIVWWNKWAMSGGALSDWAVIPLGIAGILLVATLVNLWLYASSHAADIYADIQAVRNSTPEVRMFEAAKGMHPQAVEALLIHRRAIWRIKYVPLKDVADWILDEAPTVHGGFLDFVLDHSNSFSVMPKHGILSQGSKQFDPEGMIEDYQQYDDLILLLQQKLICTQALGNQPPKWIPPWNQDLVRHRFGLDGEQYVVAEMSDAMRAIQRGQIRQMASGQLSSNDNGHSTIEHALADLEQTQEMKAKTKQIINS